MNNNRLNTGEIVEERFSTILTDPTFEKRLKAFDSRLKLMFDQRKKRWVVLEWAYDNSCYNIILVCEDENKNPLPVGEWVFNTLVAYRRRWENKKTSGANCWLDQLAYEAKCQKEKIVKNVSDDNQARIKEDITQWRKASKSIYSGCGSDAIAGYRKIPGKVTRSGSFESSKASKAAGYTNSSSIYVSDL